MHLILLFILDPFEIDLSGEKLISYSSAVQTSSEENCFLLTKIFFLEKILLALFIHLEPREIPKE